MKMVHGGDDLHSGPLGGSDGLRQLLERAQFDVDQSRMRQKAGKQLAALRKAEGIRPAFRRMADGH